MNRPTFIGPDAELAAFRYAQIHVARQLWKSVTTIAQSILMDKTDPYTRADSLEQIVVPTPNIRDFEIKTLIELSHTSKKVATILIDIYESLEDLANAPIEQIAQIVYTKSGKVIGTNAAEKIVDSLANYKY